jgi:cold-shock DNA-binding protein family
MAVICEDLIKMLDKMGNGYRHGRHSDSRTAGAVAKMLRAVADELEL